MDELIESGILLFLVNCLGCSASSELQVETAWTLTNMVCGTSNLKMRTIGNDSGRTSIGGKGDSKKAVFVPVNRTAEVESARSMLPILAEEQVIMESIKYNQVVIICGETGSGKTTQVPQFLYEGGYAVNKMICVTEPRRVAAISISQRVGHEMNLTNDIVSYQIRFEGNVTEKTKIKFVTDGVLLKEIQKDFLLSRYSVIVVDEAHERSVNSDIIIGLLSRIIKLRNDSDKNPLKLIIMSATLRVEDFTENSKLFKFPCPVIKIESRQFPVAIHFAKQTPEDYLLAAYNKVCEIHRRCPEGGILVFVTGQQEVIHLCNRLRKTFPMQNRPNGNEKDEESTNHHCQENRERYKKRKWKLFDELPKINLDDFTAMPFDEEAYSDSEESYDAFNDFDFDAGTRQCKPLYCLPLYAMLRSEKQSLVFKMPPVGCRLCVIATNVAETSITIPHVKYVIDTGKVKERVYDKTNEISTFIIKYTSQASADQRSGRAGRTSSGHCYRLYSSSVFKDEFKKFAEPEILNKPIDDLLLKMKFMNIDNVVNFPFPSNPSKESLLAAEKRLLQMGALYVKMVPNQINSCSRISELGKTMARLSVAPRYAKMIAFSQQIDLLPYVVAIVSAMITNQIFISSANFMQSANVTKQWQKMDQSHRLGDVMIMLKAACASEFAGLNKEFCERNGLRYQAMTEIRKMRTQLHKEVANISQDFRCTVDACLEPPNYRQIELIRQIILIGFFDHVARRIPTSYTTKKLKNAYKSTEVEGPVFISNESVLKDACPEFVVYQEIFESSSKKYMRVVTQIEPEWLPIYAPQACAFSK